MPHTPHLTIARRFAYVGEEIYCSNSEYMMTGINVKYLCGFLNSKLANWILKTIAASSGMGTSRWIKIYVEKIPVPLLDKPAQQPFIRLVDKIIKAKHQAEDTTALEAEIDQMVYQLYNLTADEIKIIEGSQ